MKAYIKPRIIFLPFVMNPWVEYTSDGVIPHIDSGIDVGDVTIQGKEKGTHEEWGSLW